MTPFVSPAVVPSIHALSSEYPATADPCAGRYRIEKQQQAHRRDPGRARYVEEVSPFFALMIDPRGRVWVARGVAPDVEGIDVLDPLRGYVGSIEADAFPVAFLDDARFVTIMEGPWGSRLELRRIVP